LWSPVKVNVAYEKYIASEIFIGMKHSLRFGLSHKSVNGKSTTKTSQGKNKQRFLLPVFVEATCVLPAFLNLFLVVASIMAFEPFKIDLFLRFVFIIDVEE
jgi:hypothetical protein